MATPHTSPASGLSDAAVVARQLGKVCLVSCAGMQIDKAAHTLRIGETTLHEGELLTLDGTAGAVYTGAVHTVIEPMADLRARLKQLRTAQGKVAKVVKARKAVKMPKAAAS